MIVKNESAIIRRMLESVSPYISTYCICDTGSTDNTISIIQDYFASIQIQGTIVEDAFVNFEYSRNVALNACQFQFNYDIDYILFLDADMMLYCNTDVNFDSILEKKCDIYHIQQGTSTLNYKNIRLIKPNLPCSYWGVTHEFLNFPHGSSMGDISIEDVFITHIGDGGCKNDKGSRDIALLRQGLVDKPDNARYSFYLAKTYFEMGDFENAIVYFNKNVALGGWTEERWYSYYCLGKCYRGVNDMGRAIAAWIDGYSIFDQRIENIYEIVHHYRCSEKYRIAYFYYELAQEILKSTTHRDFLFHEKDIYDVKLDYEMTVIGDHCNVHNFNLPAICMSVLANRFNVDNVMSNYKFYAPAMCDKARNGAMAADNWAILKKIGSNILTDPDFSSSTPSLCYGKNENELFIVVRFVNYTIIDETGHYIIRDNKIITKNVIARIYINPDSSWQYKDEYLVEYHNQYDGYYQGQEDIRIHSYKNDPFSPPSPSPSSSSSFFSCIKYNATRVVDGNFHIEHGIITIHDDKKKKNCTCDEMKFLEFDVDNLPVMGLTLDSVKQRGIEKNWVLFQSYGEKQHCVHQWYPLSIGDITDGKLTNIVQTSNVPPFFQQLRGSTNGIAVGNTIWFICHAVSDEQCRYYYHILVVMDKKKNKDGGHTVLSYTPFWTFEKKRIEFTLGMVYRQKENDFLIGYSTMDRDTKYTLIPKSAFDEMLIPNTF